MQFTANYFETQGFGKIAVISSVAGDRAKSSNYIYGTAKSAITTFCEGLRLRLYKKNVHVLTIKPGFVDTPMTKKLNISKLLLADPNKVANDIITGIDRNKNVIYTPWYWKYIMMFIYIIPFNLYKRMQL